LGEAAAAKAALRALGLAVADVRSRLEAGAAEADAARADGGLAGFVETGCGGGSGGGDSDGGGSGGGGGHSSQGGGVGGGGRVAVPRSLLRELGDALGRIASTAAAQAGRRTAEEAAAATAADAAAESGSALALAADAALAPNSALPLELPSSTSTGASAAAPHEATLPVEASRDGHAPWAPSRSPTDAAASEAASFRRKERDLVERVLTEISRHYNSDSDAEGGFEDF
jgi:hypothetical protein